MRQIRFPALTMLTVSIMARDGVATSSRFREHRSDRVINGIVAGARQRFSCFLLLQERLRR